MEGMSLPVRAVRTVNPYVRVLLKAAVYGSFVYFLYFCIYYATDKFWDDDFATAINTWTIPSNYEDKAHDVYSYGFALLLVLVVWLPLLGGTLIVIVTRRLPGSQPKYMRYFQEKLRFVLTYELPPRKFWAHWTDGMNTLDVSLITAFFFTMAFWFGKDLSRASGRLQAIEDAGIYLNPRWNVAMLEYAALEFGILLFVTLWLVFLPIAHNSFLQTLTGLDYHAMIRYHRWLGNVALIFTSMHGILYYVFWGMNQEFWVQFKDWSTLSTINNVAGTISWLFGLALWITAASWCRRRFFEVFYRVHIIGFMGYLLFYAIHYSGAWMFTVPGLLLWGVDLVYRTISYNNVTSVTAVKFNDTHEVAELHFQGSQRSVGCPMHRIYMLVPAISRWQWHPFSILSQNPDGRFRVTIKKYGAFTTRLFEMLERREPVAMRVHCPEEPIDPAWESEDAVVLFAGGVGSASAFIIMSHIMLVRAAALRRGEAYAARTLPHRVVFVWSVRSEAELFALDPEVAAAANDSSGWLQVHLHCTAKTVGEAPPALEPKALAKVSSTESSGSGSGSGVVGGAGVTPSATRARLASPFGFNTLRRIQPGGYGDVYWFAVHVLVFLGAFCGATMMEAYTSEKSICWNTGCGEANYNNHYWRVGTLNVVGMVIVGLGLPYLFLAFPLHLYWYLRDRSGATGELLTPYSNAEPTTCTVVGHHLAIPGTDITLPITPGRPDIHALLERTATELGPGAQVGVYGAGPDAMNENVRVTAGRLNRVTRGHFSYHRAAGTL